MSRPKVFLDLASKPTPLNAELEQLGIRVLRGEAAAAVPPDCEVVAGLLGFYDYVSRPWRAWKLKRVLGYRLEPGCAGLSQQAPLAPGPGQPPGGAGHLRHPRRH